MANRAAGAVHEERRHANMKSKHNAGFAKKALAALMSAALASGSLPVVALAEAPGGVVGSLGEESTAGTQVTAQLPARYNSAEQPWAANIKVKDEGLAGMGIAFAVTTVAEYSYAKEQYEQTGELPEELELSPAQLAYFYHNRVNDPLGNTAGDFNGMVYEGYDWAHYGLPDIGIIQHLASYSGLGLEENTPMQDVLVHIVDDGDGNPYLTDSFVPFSDAYAYDDALTLQNGLVVDLKGCDVDEGVAAIKQMVYRYGAAYSAITLNPIWYMEEPYVDDETYERGHAYYDFLGEMTRGHYVTIVGWDDDYPAENFAHARTAFGDPFTFEDEEGEYVCSDDEGIKLTTPPGDGAWIVQNCFGDYTHDDGFFYVSYYSADVTQDQVMTLDVQPADAYAYNFQYDGTADCMDLVDLTNEVDDFEVGVGTTLANSFVNTTGEDVTLDAVGFAEYNFEPASYDLAVYVGFDEADGFEDATPAYTAQVTTDGAGYRTVELDEPVTVEAGERFAVAFTLRDGLYFGIERSRVDSNYDIVAQVDPGQSFISVEEGSWNDLEAFEACARIKVLANPAGGAAQTGLVTIGDKTYYLAEDGTCVTGWVKLEDGNYAFFDEADDGAMVTDQWVRDAATGLWYYCGADGELVTGWFKDGAYWYYCEPAHNGHFGEMRTGWVKTSGKWYFLTQHGATKGAMLRDTTTPDGYKVGHDGAWVG